MWFPKPPRISGLSVLAKKALVLTPVFLSTSRSNLTSLFFFLFKPLALFLYSVTPQFKQQRVVSVCDMNGCMDTFIWGCNGVLSAFSCYNFSKISRVTEYPCPCRCIVDEYHAFLCYQNFQFQYQFIYCLLFFLNIIIFGILYMNNN